MIYILCALRRRRVETVPSARFFEVSKSAPRSAARRPPVSMWFAMLSVVFAAAAAAGPIFAGDRDLYIFMDRSARMAWRDSAGRTRLDRARAAAIEHLHSVSNSTNIILQFCPGEIVAGDKSRVLETLMACKPSTGIYELSKILVSAPAGALVFTGEELPPLEHLNIYQFGASDENVGFVGTTVNPPGVILTNASSRELRRDVVLGERRESITLKSGEFRLLEIPRGARFCKIDAPPDAFPADDTIQIPDPAFRLQFHGTVPASIRSALTAARESRGDASEKSVQLWCGPIGVSNHVPRLEYATNNFTEQNLQIRAGAPVDYLVLPKTARAAPVPCGDPWIVNGAGDCFAGTSGGAAIFGLDYNDRAVVDNAMFPLLISALVDRVVPSSPRDLDPRVSTSVGAAVDRVSPASAKSNTTKSSTRSASLNTILAFLGAATAAAAAIFIWFETRANYTI